jgi:hypothetical protein
VKQGFAIVPVTSGDGGSLYTIQYDGESQSEFDKFLENEEVQKERSSRSRLVAKLNEMVHEYGFVREFFKEEEGKRWDYVVALKEGRLRLYCLRAEDFLLIVGNGGVKKTRTYQQDSHLNASVEELQRVHKLVMNRIYSGRILVERHSGVLRGALNFSQER